LCACAFLWSNKKKKKKKKKSESGGGEPGCGNSTALDVVPGATVVHNFQRVAVLLLLDASM
jgi:hypothetical protein